MRKIQESEVESLLGEGYGYSCFMGGCQGQPTIYAVGNDFIVLEENEQVNSNPEYVSICEKQNAEGKEYFDSLQSRF